MATAVQPPATESRPANPRARLVLASLFGAAFVAAGIALALYAVPMLWNQSVSPVVASVSALADAALRIAAQLAVAGGVIWVGSKLSGDHPPKGIRGGIFLVISLAIAIFFITRAVGLALEGSDLGLPITLVVLGVQLGLSYVFLTSPRAEGWMHAIEEQGWLHTFSYKRTQGVRMRRYSLIGFLLIGLSGVYSIISHAAVGTGDWRLAIPFTGEPSAAVTPLTDIQFTIPLLLAAATFWLAWRAVNVPTFADFLIATEAEMNKVSWSNRKRLVQDTVVVLVTVVLMTLFLLFVDMFWGWLLSTVNVLPPQSQTPAGQVDPLQPGKMPDL